ncbi:MULTISPECIES: tetratricopeptide repeat protein [Actinomadura]|uniref:Tetratricopeptide repeat protein n=1 Tax=Actinomadura yumaensis TaxID=111807 RepID=A0ABW2CWH2_9ACTN|nr:tetratricopeptide repeat protein [Actinomadura sp. J1-007]
MTDNDWERRIADLWASIDDLPADEFVARMDRVAAGVPEAVAAFERASAFDSTGRPDRAVPLYRQGLEAGLTGVRRRRAVIQLASSLRALGRAEESVALLAAERERDPARAGAGERELDDAVAAFLALALTDVGREREAVALALSALSAHLPRYQRSLAACATAIT